MDASPPDSHTPPTDAQNTSSPLEAVLHRPARPVARFSFRPALILAVGAGCILALAVLAYRWFAPPSTTANLVLAPTSQVSSKGSPGPLSPTSPSTFQAAKSAPVTAELNVQVYVTGAVKNPKVVILAQTARVAEAIEKAGGFTPDADPRQLNLAAVVKDGTHVDVPVYGEKPQISEQDGGGLSGGEGGNSEPGALIDLNRATEATLETLPGIGPALAKRIVQWREQNGDFSDPAGLDDVPGIGPTLLANLVPLVTVGR